MNKLPCPFCGRDNRLVELCDRFDAGEIAWINCGSCMCNGPSVYVEKGDAITQAIYAWNSRQEKAR